MVIDVIVGAICALFIGLLVYAAIASPAADAAPIEEDEDDGA